MSDIVTTGTFAGRTFAELTEMRRKLQDALVELAGGAKVVSLSINQGAGGRAATYTAANVPDIEKLIRQINTALSGGRRAMGVVFR